MARAAFYGDMPQDGSFESRHQPNWIKTEKRHSILFFLPRFNWRVILHPIATIKEIKSKMEKDRLSEKYSVWKCSGCHFQHELPMTSRTRPIHCMMSDDGK